MRVPAGLVRLAVLLLVSATSLANAPSAAPAAPDAGGLTELHSDAGVLDVTLRAAAQKIHVGDVELDGAAYNGLYAGPVLRLRPGDLLRVHLVNALAQPTNLHFHGIRTSPLGTSDNVHLAVPAGSSFTYEVRIPATQPPGLYWYHSHLHGTSEQQVMHGLSGMLVVEGLERPGIAERLFALKDMAFDDDTGNATIDDDLHGIVQSVNGRLDSTLALRPGETQFWRFSNESANRIFHIAVPGHRFRIVATDGEAIVGARTEAVLDIMPAGRVEVLIEGGAPGTYPLLSKGTMTGTGAARVPDRVLGHVVVAGEPATPAALPQAAPPLDLRKVRIAASRSFTFSQTTTLKANEQKFFVDGRVFDLGRVDVRVPLGNVEEWTIRNDSDDLHVFHIHQLGFQVVEVNHTPVPFAGRIDTVRVPERGEVKLRLAFTDPVIVGRFVFHCHVLKHEDKGMMAQIEVFDPRPPPFGAWLRRFCLHVWWWWHGVPWSLCGLASA